MPTTKVLITVKTYPTISGKYEELVCTAGFTEDGKWIRIYPIPFRKIAYDQQYKKHEWIEINLVKNKSDFRPESYRPYSFDSEIVRGSFVDTKNYWAKRKEIVLAKVYNNMNTLIDEAKDKNVCTSLAVFRPSEIIEFNATEVVREWDRKKMEKIKSAREQGNMFEFP